MKLKDLIETNFDVVDVSKGGGYGSSKKRDKTKLSSKLLRRKADKNNMRRDDTEAPKQGFDVDTGTDMDL